jgi:hypothetical protein
MIAKRDLRFLRGGAAADTDGPPKTKAPKEFRDGLCNATGRPPSPAPGHSVKARPSAGGNETLARSFFAPARKLGL